MEPLAASSAAAIVRPAAAALHAELTAVLRDGRIVAGEVVRTSTEGMVTLAIGRHLVPAETQLQLDPGQKFLFRVEELNGEIVLRVLGGDPLEARLLDALRRVVGEDRPLGELLADLAARLRATIGSGSDRPELVRLLEALPRLPLDPTADGLALKARLLQGGLPPEAALARALRGGVALGALELLRGGLRAELLRALDGLEEGPLRELLARVLGSIEAEELLNLARQRSGEPLVLSFLVPDGDGWATARLQVPPRPEDEGRAGDEESAAEEGQRVVLEVGLSQLGPIRAELSLGPDTLAVRLSVTRPELVARIQADFETLSGRLGDGRRAVQLFARVASPAEIETSHRPLDIRFLREHHLMDVAG